VVPSSRGNSREPRKHRRRTLPVSRRSRKVVSAARRILVMCSGRREETSSSVRGCASLQQGHACSGAVAARAMTWFTSVAWSRCLIADRAASRPGRAREPPGPRAGEPAVLGDHLTAHDRRAVPARACRNHLPPAGRSRTSAGRCSASCCTANCPNFVGDFGHARSESGQLGPDNTS